MKAYYFSKVGQRLSYGDNREISQGIIHEVSGIPRIFRASKKAIDAIKYSPGSWLWIVELSGEIIEDEYNKKCAAQKTTYLQGFDATDLLREFARKCAMLNIEKIKPYCSVEDYEIIIRFLETGEIENDVVITILDCLNVPDNSVVWACAWACSDSETPPTDVAFWSAWFASGCSENPNDFTELYNNLNPMLELMIEEKLNKI